MNYTFAITKEILDLFKTNDILGGTEISNLTGLSRTIVHKYLKELVVQDKLKKVGKGSHTKYISLIEYKDDDLVGLQCRIGDGYIPDYKVQKLLEDIFYKFTAEGNILEGFEGFKSWCISRNLNIEDKINNFLNINIHIQDLQNECGLLNAKKSFGRHFEKVYLDNIYYADQYKRMEFGRGKLAEMTFYAKQSQNKELIGDSLNEIILKLECIIRKEKFDAIAITPWSIDRKNQLLGFLGNKLKGLNLPFVNIIKYYPNNIAIPQKSLKTREQRIRNARNTIFIDDKNIGKYNKVFLIDDFVGSGSTLNETASKLKYEGVKQVYGFAFVGNLNLDYEVINEV